MKNKGGRPYLTEEQKAQRKEDLLQKLEPYLKSGLSVNKALCEAKVFNSEFYKYLAEDRLFGEKVATYKQYLAVLACQAIFQELFTIVQKQHSNEPLSKEDRDFLWLYALNSNSCHEEWGRRKNINSFDPEMEIQKVKQLIQETTLPL